MAIVSQIDFNVILCHLLEMQPVTPYPCFDMILVILCGKYFFETKPVSYTESANQSTHTEPVADSNIICYI